MPDSVQNSWQYADRLPNCKMSGDCAKPPKSLEPVPNRDSVWEMCAAPAHHYGRTVEFDPPNARRLNLIHQKVDSPAVRLYNSTVCFSCCDAAGQTRTVQTHRAWRAGARGRPPRSMLALDDGCACGAAPPSLRGAHAPPSHVHVTVHLKAAVQL
jgi:hypothetical protein